ncbi:glycosyltransferase family 2 protein [Flavihumibacter sediminis]|nr:glycosyltransferase family 2 protein [Flavihumibacter sediminis]
MQQEIARPLWSVMIPAYNCSEFLADAINSVLIQDPGEKEMQIEVVDDASTDNDVEALVMEIGKGRVSYYRQEENMGSLRNFETCINRATGHYIHLLHGDDRVKPGFYGAIESLFNDYPDAGAAFTNWDFINADGTLIKEETRRAESPCIIENCLQRLSHGQLMQYVCMVVKRSVYEDLGGFYGVTYGEDWIMWARIANSYPIAYTPSSLAEYRTHYNSISGHSFLSGKNIEDLRIVFKEISLLLPDNQRAEALKSVQRNYSFWAVDAAKYMWLRTGKKQVIYRQVYQLLRLYPHGSLVLKSFSLFLFVWKRELMMNMRKAYKSLRQ